MATKVPVGNDKAPDIRRIFNWGVKITDYDELFLLAGRGDVDPGGAVRNPGDPVAQTESILAEQKTLIEASGYSLDDVIRIEFTMSKDVTVEQQHAIFDRFAEFFVSVAVKPAAGTLRVVERLAFPGMLVEYELWLAK